MENDMNNILTKLSSYTDDIIVVRDFSNNIVFINKPELKDIVDQNLGKTTLEFNKKKYAISHDLIENNGRTYYLNYFKDITKIKK